MISISRPFVKDFHGKVTVRRVCVDSDGATSVKSPSVVTVS